MNAKNGKGDMEYRTRANLLAFALLVTAGCWLLPSAFGQAITVNTPIHTNNQFNRAEPMQEWECSSPQLALGTYQLQFLDVNGSLGDYVDCHGRIHGGGSGGTVTSVSCDDLSPLFDCTVTTATTTPVIVFTQINAAAGAIFGNDTAAPAHPVFYVPGTCGDATHAVSFNVDIPDAFGCQTVTGSGTTPAPPLYAIQVNAPLGDFAGYSDFTWEDSNQNLLIGSGVLNGNADEVAIGHQNSITGNGLDFVFGFNNGAPNGTCVVVGINNEGCFMGNNVSGGVYVGLSGSSVGRQISIWPNNNGEGLTTISSFYHSFSTTLYNLACMYADQEMVDCGANAANWIGVTIDPQGLTATEGLVPISSTNSAVVNDWVCTNSSGSQVTDSGSTVGCGSSTFPVGVVTSISQLGATTPIVKLARGNGAGGGGGSPGGSPTQIQYNLGGSFAGIAGSAVDTSGDVTIAPTVPTAVALLVTAANDEPALVASSTGDGLGLDTIEAFSTNTDNSGTGSTAGVAVDAILLGSNTTGELYAQIELGGNNGEWSGGNPTESTLALLAPNANPVGFPALTSTGIHIEDQDFGGVPGSTINAAILIDAQTPGANVYSIYTGAGPSLLADIFSPGTLTLSDGTSEATLYGEGYEWNCADCDTPAYSGAACTNVGDMAGARAIYIQGAAYCGGKATGAGSGITNGQITVTAATFSANACTVYSTLTMAGVAGGAGGTAFNFTPAADITAVAGWGSTGGLLIADYPTLNTLNWSVCNQTASPIVQGSNVTFNVSAR